MNKEIITKVLQEILAQDPNYFLPKQFHVLSWKSQKIEGALITKINGQRYLGLPRKDSQGQEYWRYKPLTNSEVAGSGNSALSDSVAKFQARQAKTQERQSLIENQLNHDKSNSAEPAVSS